MAVRAFHGMITWWISYSEKTTDITTVNIKHTRKIGTQCFQCYRENKALYLRTAGVCECQRRTLPVDGSSVF